MFLSAHRNKLVLLLGAAIMACSGQDGPTTYVLYACGEKVACDDEFVCCSGICVDESTVIAAGSCEAAGFAGNSATGVTDPYDPHNHGGSDVFYPGIDTPTGAAADTQPVVDAGGSSVEDTASPDVQVDTAAPIDTPEAEDVAELLDGGAGLDAASGAGMDAADAGPGPLDTAGSEDAGPKDAGPAPDVVLSTGCKNGTITPIPAPKSDNATTFIDHLDGATKGSFEGWAMTDGYLTNCAKKKPAKPGKDFQPAHGCMGSALRLHRPLAGDISGGSVVFPKATLGLPAGTLEFWIRLPHRPTAPCTLVSQGKTSSLCSEPSFSLAVSTCGTLELSAAGAFKLMGTAIVPFGAWTHVAVTWGPQGAHLYQDGEEVASSSAKSAPKLKTGDMLRFESCLNRADKVMIDEIRISKIQRTSFNVPKPCGDGVCAAGESCTKCAKDCGSCAAFKDVTKQLPALPSGPGRIAGIWSSSPDNVFIVAAMKDGLHVYNYDGATFTKQHSYAIPTARDITMIGADKCDVRIGMAGNEKAGAGLVPFNVRYDCMTWKADEIPKTAPRIGWMWGWAQGHWFATGNDAIWHYHTDHWMLDAPVTGLKWQTTPIWGFSELDVYAFGSGAGSKTLHFGGKSWAVVGKGAPAGVTARWGWCGKELYAAGTAADQSALRTWKWNAKEWPAVLNLKGKGKDCCAVRGVWGSAPDDVWMVGRYNSLGVVLRFDGKQWAPIKMPASPEQFRTVWGSGPGDMWIGGGARNGSGKPVLLRRKSGN